ncbi:methyl-accepting chemotaxis protein [Kineosporia sp. J2-2]|uniref:Methyl-accepting chemotaxis protein n=1 Tax=Kineosporia corallincola TaxID=2835133 RepID=A0ABS5TFJ8_9ACTN|nr:methyl-accepting chemotaxis protein [Kineosporia corallincola]MBT0769863.1 methyl-accepting chemotaxis protein [Kineosporia corallincola]
MSLAPNVAARSASSSPAPRAGWLRDRSVKAKILAPILVMALVAVGVGATSLQRLSTMNTRIHALQEQRMAGVEALNELNHQLSQMYRAQFLYEVTGAQGDQKSAKATWLPTAEAADTALDAALAKYEKVAGTGGGRDAQIEQVATAAQTYRTLRDVIIFGEAPPDGFEMPDDLGTAFGDAETQLNEGVVALATLETTASQAATAEAAADFRSARIAVVASLLIGLLLAAGLALFVLRLLLRQVQALSGSLARLAEGDLTQEAEISSRDELGRMAAMANEAVRAFRGMLSTLVSGAETVSGSAAQLSAVTSRIGEGARLANERAGVVSSSSEDVSANVQTLAAGAEEMGASIGEIARNAQLAADVAGTAVARAQSTNATISKLGESSAEIGNVVKAITQIAEQTNLLALNATIEAARAGDAGKGFAVVAEEVKQLAQETARATEDIANRVEAIQADTGEAVTAISEIGTVIAQINDFQTTIAAAVEEQSATTTTMSRSVGDAAQGATGIAGNIASVAEATRSTTATLTEADAAVEQLDRVAAELRTAVGRFRL